MAHDDQVAAPSQPAAAPDAQAEAAGRDQRRLALGAQLRAARENQALSVTALGQMTRISVAFIDALEAGEFERLPGAVFGRGFVRSIARTTSLSEETAVHMIKEFEELWDRQPPKSVLKVEIKNKPTLQRGEAFFASVFTAGSLMRRGLALKLFLPAAVVVAAVSVLVLNPGLRSMLQAKMQQSGSASIATTVKTIELEKAAPTVDAAVPVVGVTDTQASQADASVDDVADAVTTTTAATVTAASTTVAVVKPAQVLELTVTETVRVRIEVDDGPSVTKELEPDSYRFTFTSKADLMIYDAAALKVSYNGKALGSLGGKGRVRRLSFDAALPGEQKL